ncbi:hypothetical protein [Mesorhizobium sp. M0019]|uniref:hypothetical protein n=1 Tax=Mesorhizobium sp. M0019 TaxID=2956845 RepID=UPI00333838D4
MFNSNIGRLRFFFYSAALLVAEIVTFVLCVVLTIGIEGLANSKPGPSREGLAAAVLVASLVIVLLREFRLASKPRRARVGLDPLVLYRVLDPVCDSAGRHCSCRKIRRRRFAFRP